MLLDEIISDLAPQEEKQKTTCSDLAAYVAGREGSEDGALCNDRATQVLVIIHAMLLIYFDSLTFFLLLCCGKNDSLIGKIY
jgi:hypothetical protein